MERFYKYMEWDFVTMAYKYERVRRVWKWIQLKLLQQHYFRLVLVVLFFFEHRFEQ